MNILELFCQHQFAEKFNNADIKSVITVDGFQFDIRVVNNLIYCNGLPANEFFDEAMLTSTERIEYENAIELYLGAYQKEKEQNLILLKRETVE